MEPTSNFICFKCKNYDDIMGCSAFPDGIPNEIIMSNVHDKPLPNQENNLIFEKRKKTENESNRSATKNA